MRLEVNVTKTRFFVLLATILLLGGAIAVYAYNFDWRTQPTNNPSVMGHSPDEIVGDLRCGQNQALTLADGTWNCISVGGGTGNGNRDWYGSTTTGARKFIANLGDVPTSGAGCESQKDHATCPADSFVVGVDRCVTAGTTRMAVLCEGFAASSQTSGSESGVSKITAGNGISVTPASGTGDVAVAVVNANAAGHVKGGLYGHCFQPDPQSHAKCEAKAPATCDSYGNYCGCPTGYEKVTLGRAVGGYALDSSYSCYKI